LNQYVMRFDTVTFLHNADGSPGKLVCIATGLTTIAGEVAAGWNMVAVPLLVNDFRKSSLYPTASSSAFAYDGSYKRRDTLEIGIGYWVKFSSAQEVSYVGPIVARETIDVRVSWNMIGSITSPIPVNTITSLPGGIITSKFYTYSGSYVYDDTIRPGNAYWVKVNEAGKLILATSPSIVPANRIRIERTSETPPQPPEAEISHLKSEIPEQFALEQNYPNPFNPVTVIRYSLPVSGRVTMKVYTMLGEEVGTLVDETQDAGYWSVRWDASRAPSGVYIYKLTAESFVDVKKMILIK